MLRKREEKSRAQRTSAVAYIMICVHDPYVYVSSFDEWKKNSNDLKRRKILGLKEENVRYKNNFITIYCVHFVASASTSYFFPQFILEKLITLKKLLLRNCIFSMKSEMNCKTKRMNERTN